MVRDTSVSKKEEFSAFVANYCGLINGSGRRASDTNDELKIERERAQDFCGAILFN